MIMVTHYVSSLSNGKSYLKLLVKAGNVLNRNKPSIVRLSLYGFVATVPNFETPKSLVTS